MAEKRRGGVRVRSAVLALTVAVAACGTQPAVVAPLPVAAQTAEVGGGDAASFEQLGSPVLLAAALRYPERAAELEPPLSLTASDGTGLRLTAFEAEAYVDGPLAFTETKLTFENPQDRILEGRFSITLPPGAAISRVAMRLDDGWQEAEVVEREAAQRAYEDFLHRKQDPLLLEKEAGNLFSARVFPIPARGAKEIIVSYSQEIEAGQPYRLQVAGLPEVGRFRANVLSSDGARHTVEKTSYRPLRDVEVATKSKALGLRSGPYAMVRVRPELKNEPLPITGLTVLFDTSASRVLGFSAEVAALGELIDELEKIHGGTAQLHVAAFDQGVLPIYSGTLAGFGARQLDRIRARRPLGASDPGKALAWVARHAPAERVLLVTDGMVTAGASEGEALDRSVTALSASTKRLDVVARGGIRDEAVLGRLARGRLETDGVVLDGSLPAPELARRMSQTTVSDVAVEVSGSEWVWPQRLTGLQPGDEALVYAGFPREGRAPDKVTVKLSGSMDQTAQVTLAPAEEKLLERAAVQAEIARLTEERLDLAAERSEERERLKLRIVDLSTRYRVLSDFTALLVLETEDDYRRFGIERNALADILTVGPKGLSVVSRGQPVVLAVAAPSADDGELQKNKDKKESSRDTSVLEAEAGGAVAATAAFDQDSDGRPDPMDMADGEGFGGDAKVAAPPAMRPPTAPPPPPPPAPPPPSRAQPPGAFGPNDATVRVRPGPVATSPAPESRPESPSEERAEAEPEPTGPPPLTGRFAAIAELIARGDRETAVVSALEWHGDEPGDVMALVALGESLEALRQPALAARCYGSILDLHPSRADLRRFAASRIERLEGALDLAVDAYRRAVELRPDHLTGHRALAYGLLRAGKLAEAFEALERGLSRDYPGGRFAGGERVLAEDLALVGAAWAARDPQRRAEIEQRVRAKGGALESEPSVRFVLSWETDANDVDFHIYDDKGGHAFYSRPALPSGGELYADVTTGYGPECFTIRGKPTAGPYKIKLHYYSRGPMGYGMGRLEVVRHDGHGKISVESRPFVVMNDDAYVDLGQIAG